MLTAQGTIIPPVVNVPASLQGYAIRPGEANVINAFYPFGDPRRYGAAADGITDDSTAWGHADANATALGGMLQPSVGTYHIAANLSIASPVVMQSGVLIDVPNGITVHVNGGFGASPDHHFVLHGTGTVEFGSAPNQWPNIPMSSGYGYPEWWGINGTTAPYDDVAVQAAFDSQLPILFLRHYYIGGTVDLSITEACVNFNKFKLVRIGATPVDAVLHLRCSHSRVYNLAVDASLDTGVTSAVRWFGDVDHPYPGRNEFFGFKLEQCLIGLTVGEQLGNVPNNVPLSESTVYSFDATSCQTALLGNQPNGKVHFVGGTFAVDKGNWPGDGVATGTFRYADGCAVNNRPSSAGGTVGGAEFAFIGASIEAGESSLGYGVRGANMMFKGCTFELFNGILIEGDRVYIDGAQDTLSGFGASQAAITVAAGTTGVLTLRDLYAQKGSDSANPFVDGSAATTFRVESDNCFIDGWNWKLNGALVPLISGCDFVLRRTRVRDFAKALDVVVNMTPNNLPGAKYDRTGASMSPIADKTAKGNWNSDAATGAGANYFAGSADSPVGFSSSIELGSVAGQAMAIDSATGIAASVQVVSTEAVVVRFQVKVPISNGNVIVDLQWWKFDGVTRSAIASTRVFNVSSAVLTANFQKFSAIATVPNDAQLATLFVYVDGGTVARFCDLRVM